MIAPDNDSHYLEAITGRQIDFGQAGDSAAQWRRPGGTGHGPCGGAGLELGVHGNPGVEHLGHGAALFRLAGGILEGLGAGARNDGFDGQVDGRDGKAVVHLVQRDFGLGVQALGDHARFGQDVRQRHGEAAGMGRAQQFLGVGAGRVAEAGVETIGLVLERAALRGDRAFAGLQVARPGGGCGFLHA